MTWDTKVVNSSGERITVNGNQLDDDENVVLRANHDILINVPQVGTVHLTEPGSDNFHQYIPMTWAVKVIAGPAGSYVRYWGYEGGPLLQITINDDRTFSMPTACNISFDRVPIIDAPITQYSGVYETDTQWWGDFFSPMCINDDGTVSFGATTIPVQRITYNSTTASVSFDWTQYKDTSFKVSFSIIGVGDSTTLSGTLNPRPQDGGVAFSGSITSFYQKPSLTNIRAYDGFLQNGDLIDFRTQPNHMPLTVNDDGRVVESQVQTAASLQLRVTKLPTMQGFFLKAVTSNKYLRVPYDDSYDVYCDHTDQSWASAFHLYLCMDGDVLLGWGDSAVPANSAFMTTMSDHYIKVQHVSFLSSAQEFAMSFTGATAPPPSLAAAKNDAALTAVTDTPCDQVNAKLLYHVTVGMLPLLGAGDVTLDAAMMPTIKLIMTEYLSLLAAPFLVFKELLAVSVSTDQGKLILFAGLANLVHEIYQVAPDLINRFIRTAWEKVRDSVHWFDPIRAGVSLANWYFCQSQDQWVQGMLKFGRYVNWTLTLYAMKDDVARCLMEPGIPRDL